MIWKNVTCSLYHDITKEPSSSIETENLQKEIVGWMQKGILNGEGFVMQLLFGILRSNRTHTMIKTVTTFINLIRGKYVVIYRKNWVYTFRFISLNE